MSGARERTPPPQRATLRQVKVGKFTYHADNSPEEVVTDVAREFKAQGETFKVGYLKVRPTKPLPPVPGQTHHHHDEPSAVAGGVGG